MKTRIRSLNMYTTTRSSIVCDQRRVRCISTQTIHHLQIPYSDCWSRIRRSTLVIIYLFEARRLDDLLLSPRPPHSAALLSSHRRRMLRLLNTPSSNIRAAP
eukprot:4035036-Pyramimonas_sp.AAC.1